MAKNGKSKGKTDVERDLAAVQRWFEERSIKKVKVGAVDVDGVWRGKYISLDKFFSAAKGGLGFCDVVFGWDLADELYDNAEVTGWHTGYPDQPLDAKMSTAARRMVDLRACSGASGEVSMAGLPYSTVPLRVRPITTW